MWVWKKNIEMGKRIYNIDKVREIVESNNYKLISTEYINCHEKLKMICDKGHEFEIKWYKFQYGHRCTICAGNIKYTHDHIKNNIEKEGYKLLSTDYKNNKQKLDVICNKGHEFSIRYYDWITGHRCRKCYEERISYSLDEVKKIIKEGDYELISSNYKNVNEHIDIKCDKGHVYKGTLHNFLSFSRCPICSRKKHQSKGEKEVVDFIHQIYDGIII
jgi:hypothetical protein